MNSATPHDDAEAIRILSNAGKRPNAKQPTAAMVFEVCLGNEQDAQPPAELGLYPAGDYHALCIGRGALFWTGFGLRLPVHFKILEPLAGTCANVDENYADAVGQVVSRRYRVKEIDGAVTCQPRSDLAKETQRAVGYRLIPGKDRIILQAFVGSEFIIRLRTPETDVDGDPHTPEARYSLVGKVVARVDE